MYVLLQCIRMHQNQILDIPYVGRGQTIKTKIVTIVLQSQSCLQTEK